MLAVSYEKSACLHSFEDASTEWTTCKWFLCKEENIQLCTANEEHHGNNEETCQNFGILTLAADKQDIYHSLTFPLIFVSSLLSSFSMLFYL